MRNRGCWVYFIQHGTDGPIKIGCALNVRSRVRALQEWNPVPLRLLGYCHGHLNHERALHKRFAEHRVRGEWFRPVPELLTYIKEYAGAGHA